MAYPSYESNGGIGANAGTDTVDIPYPSTVDSDDILICQLLCEANDTFTAPSGWAKVDDHTGQSRMSDSLWWIRASGSESGTATFDRGTSTGNTIAGIMSRYSGCVTTGTPYEGLQDYGCLETDSIPISAITTTGIERLVMGFTQIEDDQEFSLPTDYTDCFSLGSTVGNDCHFRTFYQEVATASTTTARTSTSSRSKYCGYYGIALIPTSGSSEDDLTSTDVESGSSIVEDATIGQTHVITSSDVETGNSLVQNASIGQVHSLSSSIVEAQNPIVGTPTLTDVAGIDNLTSTNVESQSPTIESTDLGQTHILSNTNVESGNPLIGSPTLEEGSDSLTATNVESGNALVESASLGQIHELNASNVVSGNPDVGSPSFNDYIETFGYILKTMNRTFADYELTQEQINNFQNKL